MHLILNALLEKWKERIHVHVVTNFGQTKYVHITF